MGEQNAVLDSYEHHEGRRTIHELHHIQYVWLSRPRSLCGNSDRGGRTGLRCRIICGADREETNRLMEMERVEALSFFYTTGDAGHLLLGGIFN